MDDDDDDDDDDAIAIAIAIRPEEALKRWNGSTQATGKHCRNLHNLPIVGMVIQSFVSVKQTYLVIVTTFIDGYFAIALIHWLIWVRKNETIDCLKCGNREKEVAHVLHNTNFTGQIESLEHHLSRSVDRPSR